MKVMKGRGTIELKWWLDGQGGPALGRCHRHSAANVRGPFCWLVQASAVQASL